MSLAKSASKTPAGYYLAPRVRPELIDDWRAGGEAPEATLGLPVSVPENKLTGSGVPEYRPSGRSYASIR
jgi:hypothetical protein